MSKITINIFSNTESVYITNLYSYVTEPYNTPYESINWSEIYKYYPPNGIQYINPFQRTFPNTDINLLDNPYVLRITSTPFDNFSLKNFYKKI